jgi:hypothetical protein
MGNKVRFLLHKLDGKTTYVVEEEYMTPDGRIHGQDKDLYDWPGARMVLMEKPYRTGCVKLALERLDELCKKHKVENRTLSASFDALASDWMDY